MREKLDDPFFGLELEKARQYKLDRLRQSTYARITSRLPVWKQAKWKEYITLHEKKTDGHHLNALEEMTYNSFPAEGLDHEQSYNNCTTAFRWLMQCVAVHNRTEKEIKKARSIKSIKAVKEPVYPVWKE